MKLFKKLVSIAILSCAVTPLVWAEVSPKDSIVKIYTVFNRHDYYEPWQMKGQESGIASGCVISGLRILTSAHVVADQTFIEVKRAGNTKKYIAEVEVVAHECDLALLKVDDTSFFSGVKPLEIGGLAELRDKVTVYGFPIGGDELSITEGVVSRVEHIKYTHSKAFLLTCQIDAAINPGSSGGPVIKNDKIVGIAFQGLHPAVSENIGYMVPGPIIMHFLKDIEDGKYDGFPGFGMSFQKMESADMRSKYNMAKEQSGILVNKIYPTSPVRGILKSEDIILSIDGENIENDGTIKFRKDERTFYGYVYKNKQLNDTVKFEILRDNRISNVEIKLSTPTDFGKLVPHDQYDVSPTYYILGGLVFEPLTLNFLKEWGRYWREAAPVDLLYYYDFVEPTDDRREIIVLVQVLADKINVGYHDWRHNVISYVNGKKISNMKDLITAFEEYEGVYYTIVDDEGQKMVLDKNNVDTYSPRILKKYQISSDRSEDLR